MPWRPALAAGALLALVLGACGGTAARGAISGATPALAGTLTILAAASLNESFDALANEFRTEHPGVTIRTSYAGSGALVAQIVNGAEADLFASADEASMRRLVDAKLSDGDPRIFANNRLQIAVRAGNPKKITQLADLARSDVIVVLGAASVPIGAYARQAFDKAGISVAPKSLETDVKQVVAKVALGEADAGIVYRTDVRSGGARIQGVDIPDRYDVVATYPIAVVKGARNETAANAFIDLVRSARGREVLAGFGFILP